MHGCILYQELQDLHKPSVSSKSIHSKQKSSFPNLAYDHMAFFFILFFIGFLNYFQNYLQEKKNQLVIRVVIIQSKQHLAKLKEHSAEM